MVEDETSIPRSGISMLCNDQEVPTPENWSARSPNQTSSSNRGFAATHGRDVPGRLQPRKSNYFAALTVSTQMRAFDG
jgi:hypothetical protein